MKLAFKPDEHHTSTYRCKHIVRKAEEGSAHLSDRETRSHKIPSLQMQSSSFWARESCLSSKMSSASLLDSHVANKRHRPTPPPPIANHLNIFSWNQSRGNPYAAQGSPSKLAGDTHGCAAVGECVHADRAAQLVWRDGGWGRAPLLQGVLPLQVLSPCSLNAAEKPSNMSLPVITHRLRRARRRGLVLETEKL